jgi:hypothetical protein
MKCSCGCETEADTTLFGDSEASVGLSGTWVSYACWFRDRIACGGRIRARRALVAPQPEFGLPTAALWPVPAPVVWARRVDDEWVDVRPGAHTAVAQADTRCSGCAEGGKGAMCVYCAHRDSQDDFETQCAMWNPGARAAQARMDAMDKRERVPETATSRELAKAHPWSNCDD